MPGDRPMQHNGRRTENAWRSAIRVPISDRTPLQPVRGVLLVDLDTGAPASKPRVAGLAGNGGLRDEIPWTKSQVLRGMDDQLKTRLICRCGARMKLARQLPWLDHRLPAILLFQCTDCGHVDMIEWPESAGEEAP
jgi:hypothetical protein